MSDEEELNATVKINITQKKIECAVRDTVNKIMPPHRMEKRVEAHMQKQLDRLTILVDRKIKDIEHLNYSQRDARSAVLRKITDMQDYEIRVAVKDVVESQLRDCLDVTIKHLVATGMTLQLGNRYNGKCNLTVEEADAGPTDT